MQPPYAVEYITLELDAEILKKASSKTDLDRHILGQTQGEDVLIRKGYDISLLLYISNLISDSSRELVLETENGEFVQIFDFTSHPAIRPAAINTALATIRNDFEISSRVAKEHTYNLTDLWSKHKRSDTTKSLYLCIKELSTSYSDCEQTVLIGTSPAVLFLLVQQLVSNHTKELWYRESSNSTGVQIY